MKALIWLLGITFVVLVIGFASQDLLRNLLFKDRFTVRPFGTEISRISIKQTAEGSLDTVTVFEGGKGLNTNFRKAGLNIFLIYKDDNLLTSFEQFKRSVVTTHDTEGDSTEVNLNIFGPDQTL
jgi:hypothetical protein